MSAAERPPRQRPGREGGAEPCPQETAGTWSPVPEDEDARLAELRGLEAVTAPLESNLTAIAELATRICATPIALVNMLSERLQHFKGRVGIPMEALDRHIGFCSHTVYGRVLMEVPDALADERFRDDPVVVDEPQVRFYCGAPVISSRGHVLGTVCVLDVRPRRLTPEQRGALMALAACVVALIERYHYAHEVEQTAQQRAKVEELKQSFLRNVNHELRTPLTSIRSYLQLIQDDAAELDEATEHRFLAVIERNSDRLLEQLDELLLMASLSADTVAFVPEPIDLPALVRSVTEAAGDTVARKRHTLTLHAPEQVNAWADAGRLRHALAHLLDNAIKFTPDGGRITVRVTAIPAPAVEICDTGIGITEHEIEHVFDDFYRTPQAEHQAIGGIGIGLSIVKKIIALHGGSLRLTSAPHQGTCAHLTLPAPPESAAPASP
ncbi:GAF domain-containing sensor histidine kinase [Planomonospora sp. ID67723]|uniref:GAF domain-containing sensor histidine kinase n=1 Tax=Planomonospora sp. ID67723 TaxID=2738134 RepID=UPI0018C3EB85|nr:GAF domain-containing sensor histidine kinase [Planomonospora sp. ID67723]MBG0831449.1 GAF domain-containing sensor histidine kinase [Planomonospora sp. ID67723]